MQGVIATSRLGRAGIVQLAVADIDPNPNQPRTVFDPAALEELAASIREYGVISPLSVRLHYGRYELVAGERRLRAARMAGLKKVPCVVLDVDMEESSLLAMVENVQRQDLNFAEEARGIANLIRLFDMSQEECARRLGRSQSAGGRARRRAHRAPRPRPAAPARPGRAAPRAGVHSRKGPQRGADGRICRFPARAAGKPSAPPRADTEGRARVPQQPQPQPGRDEARRHRGRHDPPGDGGRADRHHIHPQAKIAKGAAGPFGLHFPAVSDILCTKRAVTNVRSL